MDQSEVLGELKEFKRATLSELSDIKTDIRELKQFKWKIDGRNAALVVFLTLITSVLTVWVSK